MRSHPSRAPTSAGALLAFFAVLACGRQTTPTISPEEAVLARRVEGVRALLSAGRRGPLIPFQEVLAVVDERVMRDLISSVAPYERVVDDEYKVRVDSAKVEFRAGFALVRLDGRASLAHRPDDETYADISLYSGLNVLGVDPTSGVLRARLQIIAFEARRVGVLGMEPPVRRLVENLTREKLSTFDVFNSDIELPVRFDETIELPEVDEGDEDDRIRIPAATLPVRLAVQDVKVMGRKLWIAIGLAVLPHPPEPARDSSRLGERPSGGEDRGRWSGEDRAAALAAVATVGVGWPLEIEHARSDSARRSLAQLRVTYRALEDSLTGLVSRDTLVREIAADTVSVALAVHKRLLDELARELSVHYLDEVELDLSPEKPVEEEKPLKVKTPLGKVKAGDWRVHLEIHRLRGVLSAGTPEMTFVGANRIHVVVPVAIRQGQGAGTIHFEWDAGWLAELVCDDFQTTLDIAGVVVPDQYEVGGDFVFSARGKTIVAQPEFPREKFRIKVDLTADSWSKVRRILTAQDEAGKCKPLDVEELEEKLRAIGMKGFKVKIPRSIFKTIGIPAGVSESVQVEDRRLRLSVLPEVLRTTPDMLWYRASVRSQRGEAAPLRSTEKNPDHAPRP
jgi:hypothetical protein